LIGIVHFMGYDSNQPGAESPTSMAGDEFFADKVSRFFRETRWLPILGLLVYLVAVIPIVYQYQAKRPLNPDPFLYAQVAKEMLQGKRLYSETWQDKPPLAFVPYMIPQALGLREYPNFGLLLGVVLSIEAGIFFVYFRKYPAGAFACVFFLTLFPLSGWDLGWPSTEHFANPFLALMLLLGLTILRRRSFDLWHAAVLGALMVVTLHIRQNAAIAGILPLTAMLYSRESPGRKIGGLAILCAVAAICWGMILLWITRVGDLHGYFYTVFEYPRLYAHDGSLSQVLDLFIAGLQTPLPYLVLVFAGIALFGEYRWPVIISVILAAVTTALPLRGSEHYWVGWFPFIAIYIALALQSRLIPRSGLRWAGTGSIFLVGAIGAAMRLPDVATDPRYKRLSYLQQYTDTLVPPGSTLLVCAPMTIEPLVYMSHLPAANTYSFVFQLLSPQGDILPKPMDQILDDYLSHPPDIILVSGNYLDEANNGAIASPSNPAILIRMLGEHYRYQAHMPAPGLIFLIRVPGIAQMPAHSD
jgi:hypothetical protein